MNTARGWSRWIRFMLPTAALAFACGTTAYAEPPPVDAARLPPGGLEAYGWTRLHWLARTGTAESIRSSLDAGLALESRDRFGRTPLHLAVLAVNPEAVRALLEAGADVNARDQWGVTPLRRAQLLSETRNWSMEPVSVLLRAHGGRKPDPPVRPTLPTD